MKIDIIEKEKPINKTLKSLIPILKQGNDKKSLRICLINKDEFYIDEDCVIEYWADSLKITTTMKIAFINMDNVVYYEISRNKEILQDKINELKENFESIYIPPLEARKISEKLWDYHISNDTHHKSQYKEERDLNKRLQNKTIERIVISYYDDDDCEQLTIKFDDGTYWELKTRDADGFYSRFESTIYY